MIRRNKRYEAMYDWWRGQKQKTLTRQWKWKYSWGDWSYCKAIVGDYWIITGKRHHHHEFNCMWCQWLMVESRRGQNWALTTPSSRPTAQRFWLLHTALLSTTWTKKRRFNRGLNHTVASGGACFPACHRHARTWKCVTACSAFLGTVEKAFNTTDSTISNVLHFS